MPLNHMQSKRAGKAAPDMENRASSRPCSSEACRLGKMFDTCVPYCAWRNLRRSTQKQVVNEICWGELEACFRPCAQYLDKSSLDRILAQLSDLVLAGREEVKVSRKFAHSG